MKKTQEEKEEEEENTGKQIKPRVLEIPTGRKQLMPHTVGSPDLMQGFTKLITPSEAASPCNFSWSMETRTCKEPPPSPRPVQLSLLFLSFPRPPPSPRPVQPSLLTLPSPVTLFSLLTLLSPVTLLSLLTRHPALTPHPSPCSHSSPVTLPSLLTLLSPVTLLSHPLLLH
ncbi:hypothetical protein Pcinc_013817 [Petrolisthes cinctipes]|uniref:Uncharacterized protein n=1 Tax=Petrolisthes cinctipes TaxID=88211 RepID=A0AAE1FW84_PETCI|nr:hypothetical protein Pcinc_013817 [Petrolisthes cinctipes]